MNYTETKNAYLALADQISALVDGINQTVDLGGGYAMKVEVHTRANPGVYYRLIPSSGTMSMDVNNIPGVVLHRYYTNAKSIEEWKQDLLPDFPTMIHA